MEQKVAIYIRVSTVHQIDKESLPFQRRELINYAQYVLNIDNYEIFEDAGYSGKNTQRPAFQNMMNKIRIGEFSHLLVWKIDRISRNIIDFANMFNELKKNNVIFVSKNEQFDTSSAIGEAILKIILIFAELERNLTSERVTDVMISRAKDGEWNGGRIPFGYNYDKEKRIFNVNETEAITVKLIFELYEQVKSMTKVADYLKEHNILNRNNKNFSSASIGLILSNIFYTGNYRYNYRKQGDRGQVKKEIEWVTVENHHPGIISMKTFNETTQIRDVNRKLRDEQMMKAHSQTKHIHIFRGILTCICGGKMIPHLGKKRKNGYRPSEYACYNRAFGHLCTNKYVNDIYLGNFVLNFIANLYKAYNSFGKTTTEATLEKKLLRGTAFTDIKKVVGIDSIYNCFKRKLKAKDTNSDFICEITKQPKIVQNNNLNQLEILDKEKNKYERALERLKNIYLFSDESMDENEYILSKRDLENKLKDVIAKTEELSHDNILSVENDEFIKLTSCFLLEQNLANKRELDFVKLVLSVDTEIIKNFILKVFENFYIKDGKITSLTLKNGLKICFYY